MLEATEQQMDWNIIYVLIATSAKEFDETKGGMHVDLEVKGTERVGD